MLYGASEKTSSRLLKCKISTIQKIKDYFKLAEFKSTLEEVASKVNWIGKVKIYHSQMGFEIVPIEADVEEARNSRVREEVNEVISKIAKGVNDGS